MGNKLCGTCLDSGDVGLAFKLKATGDIEDVDRFRYHVVKKDMGVFISSYTITCRLSKHFYSFHVPFSRPHTTFSTDIMRKQDFLKKYKRSEI